MKTSLFGILAVIALAAGVSAHQPGATRDAAKDLAAARAVMDAQVAAWNRGDLAGYMDTYAREDSLTFVGSTGVTRGWQKVFDRYKTVYGTREKMGTLAFSELEFTPLGDAHILGSGRWQLTRQADAPHGRFTVVLRRTPAGWRIVYDHSSSES